MNFDKKRRSRVQGGWATCRNQTLSCADKGKQVSSLNISDYSDKDTKDNGTASFSHSSSKCTYLNDEVSSISSTAPSSNDRKFVYKEQNNEFNPKEPLRSKKAGGMETSDFIIENLYLGPISSAKNERDLKSKGITHILSILQKPLQESVRHRRVIKTIRAVDTPGCDIMQTFPECFAFIDLARDNNQAVLVHCQAGRSRSASVVIAYLMHRFNLSFLQARDRVRGMRPEINPNSGFVEQLQRFEYIRKSKNFLQQTKKTANDIKRTKESQNTTINTEVMQSTTKDNNCDLQQSPAEAVYSGSHSGSNPHSAELQKRLSDDCTYRCKRCRTKLFSNEDLLSPHSEGQGQAAFDWRSKIPANQRQPQISSDQSCERMYDQQDWQCRVALFINPLPWMVNLEADSGKLHCPKCSTKVGSFVWHGSQCPCGAWVTPAFHISWRAVDNFPDTSKKNSSSSTNNNTSISKNESSTSIQNSSSSDDIIFSNSNKTENDSDLDNASLSLMCEGATKDSLEDNSDTKSSEP